MAKEVKGNSLIVVHNRVEMKHLKLIRLFLIALFTIILTAPEKAYAQDPEFTQFYANPLYLNPAFAGTARCPRLIMNYRNQWPGVANVTFVTYSASYDQYVEGLHGGLGLLILNDKAGEATWTNGQYSGMYSYQMNISRKVSLKAGFQGTYMQHSIDKDKIIFGDQIDNKYGVVYVTQDIIENPSISFFDASAGLLVYGKKFFTGFAAHHLTNPEEKFIQGGNLPMKLTFHAGTIMYLEEPTRSAKSTGKYISPNILYQQQLAFSQINLGMYYAHGPIVAGIWARYSSPNFDSMILLLGIEQGIFKFGYSYDFPISALNLRNTHGSHEFSLAMQFPCKPKKKKFRTITCPSF